MVVGALCVHLPNLHLANTAAMALGEVVQRTRCLSMRSSNEHDGSRDDEHDIVGHPFFRLLSAIAVQGTEDEGVLDGSGGKQWRQDKVVGVRARKEWCHRVSGASTTEKMFWSCEPTKHIRRHRLHG